jgi:putative transposase|tara:strand:+ start:106 stop:528 length:423 start_codon:yes stop_codon:yes gene_type:complete
MAQQYGSWNGTNRASMSSTSLLINTPGTSLPAGRVVRGLEIVIAEHGKSRRIQLKNIAEMVSTTFVDYCEWHNQIVYIQPDKPNHNAYTERFNRSFRHEVLHANVFGTVADARGIAWAWRTSYDEKRSGAALDNVPPAKF